MTILFTEEDAEKANQEWGFNCGPGALCGILGITPTQIRPHMMDFEAKRYTNPTLMFSVLDRLFVSYRQIYRADNPDPAAWKWPNFGLVRIQWGGPWTKPGVPMRARYRLTHWIACRTIDGKQVIFDVNTVKYGWVPAAGWEKSVVPWLLEGYPKSDGTWWPTHGIEIDLQDGD